MIDKQFDDILKRKLTDMTEASSSDWSAFEQKLDAAQVSDGGGAENFDNAIKQKLAGMTAASISSDWSTFEHMLDQDQLTDDMLDDKVSQEMNNMRAPYRQDHWELLHTALEYQKQRNNSIIGYKVIELSLLLILLLSANNMYKYLPSTFEVEKPMIYAGIDKPTDDVKIVDRSTEILPIESVDQNSLTNVTSSVIVETAENQTILATPSFATQTPLINHIENVTLANMINIAGSDSAIGNIIGNAIAYTTSKQQADDAESITSVSYNKITTEYINTPTIAMLKLDNVQAQQSAILTRRTTNHSPQYIIPNTKKEKSLLVYAGLDNNLVNSPFDDVYDTEGFRTYGIGYSAGVEYGIKNGKKEISIGLGYSNRSYQPRIIEEVTGNPILTHFETSLDNIEFDIMSLSAGMKYMLIETDKWGLDLGVGVSANIVISSDYSIETRTIRDGKQVGSRDGRFPFVDLNDKPLHDGIFENGSLQENIYLTTDISLGLYRQLSERTTFTLRPEYSAHSFSNGIGPNNDLINNLSLNLGVRYTL